MIYRKCCKFTATKKDSLLKFVTELALIFVDYFWADIEAVAKALLKRQTLTGAEVLEAILAARRRSGRRGRIGLSRGRLGDPKVFFLSTSTR